ncbi:hypothetical protein KEM54_002670 [Ascosphaera aggregata]|nr:hypothetical protein KEM54_002670 [Ascosphaera aggregata]
MFTTTAARDEALRALSNVRSVEAEKGKSVKISVKKFSEAKERGTEKVALARFGERRVKMPKFKVYEIMNGKLSGGKLYIFFEESTSMGKAGPLKLGDGKEKSWQWASANCVLCSGTGHYAQECKAKTPMSLLGPKITQQAVAAPSGGLSGGAKDAPKA